MAAGSKKRPQPAKKIARKSATKRARKARPVNVTKLTDKEFIRKFSEVHGFLMEVSRRFFLATRNNDYQMMAELSKEMSSVVGHSIYEVNKCLEETVESLKQLDPASGLAEPSSGNRSFR